MIRRRLIFFCGVSISPGLCGGFDGVLGRYLIKIIYSLVFTFLLKVVAGSHAKAWWLCEKGHEWEAQIKSRVKQGVGCPYCSNKHCLKGYNDLASRFPDLLAEWDWKKNVDIKPDEIVYGSGKKVWWKCSAGHSWKAPIYRRVRGRGCPICRHEHMKSDNW